MRGESDLNILLRSMSAQLIDELYVFVTCPTGFRPEGLSPRMSFEEAEGTTLVLLKSEAELYELEYEFPCRMITLAIHSSLEAVGFIAKISSELAKHNISVNPVSGYFHDHLFVPDGKENEVLEILEQLTRQKT